MSLHKLIFDTTNTEDGHNVGAYLRASDGTLLTHTDVSGKKALDVRVAEGINVEVDLSHVDDSVRLGDGTILNTLTTVASDNGLDVYLINASIAVTATDLDIRDLTHVSDSVKIGDGTDFLAVAADGSIAITDNGGSLTVDAVDLDIRDLTAASDSIDSWLNDGAGTALTSTLVSGDQALDVNISNTISINDAALADTAIATAAETLDTANTAQNIIVSALASRKYLWVYNNDSKEMEIGAAGFAVGAGFPVPPGSMVHMRAGASVDIEFNSTKINHAIRTMELS